MTIAGLLIVGAVGYGLWHLGGAFCRWRLQRFFDSGAWDPSRGKWPGRAIIRPDKSFARSGLTNH